MLSILTVLYETCCTGWRPKETKPLAKTDAELRDEDMKIIIESFKRKMERMRESRTKCC